MLTYAVLVGEHRVVFKQCVDLALERILLLEIGLLLL
jgi:hypothetical protein